MGLTSALCVLCLCLNLSNGQFQALPDLSRILQTLGYGHLSRTQQVNNEAHNAVNPATTLTQQSLMAPVNSYNRLVGAISTGWDGMEHQIEDRIDTTADNAVDAAEQIVSKATDYLENAKEQQESQVSNGWNSFMFNQWGVMEDKLEQKVDQLDTNMDNSVELVKTVYGDQVADTVETALDTTKDVIDNTVDAASDALDTVKDTFDDLTDDWYLSFDSLDDGWDNTNDNNDWFNGQTTNAWNSDQDSGWDSYAYSF